MKEINYRLSILFLLILSFTNWSRIYSQTSTYTNPIISGAYPDPSICRVGEDYYLSNSSFEYFPGVPIWHSKDLVNWSHAGFGIHRPEQFNFDGLASSAGAWAGTIRYNKGTFYLPLTWVDWRMKVGFKNVILTADNPSGPWSSPYVITDTIWGIDPSLFFDDDGKCYWLMNHPPVGFSHPGAASVMLQEIDLTSLKLIGSPSYIGRGAMIDSKYPEGPKMFKKDGYYYLLIAEGGTGLFHAITISRSKNITGPYENYEGNPILSHRSMGYTTPFINIGHADLVQTQTGEWWMVCLGSRPLNRKNSILGRETFLVPVQWDKDQWPIISPGYGQVPVNENFPNLPVHSVPPISSRDEFNSTQLAHIWTFIRTPKSNFYSLTEKPGFLKIKPLNAISNAPPEPAFIGQRLKYRDAEISTSVLFNTKYTGEMAGLLIYKSEKALLKFVLNSKSELKVINRTDSVETELFNAKVLSKEALSLKIIQKESQFSFFYKENQCDWKEAVMDFDGSLFSVEKSGGYMGTFIGLYAESQKVSDSFALYDWFDYKEIKP